MKQPNELHQPIVTDEEARRLDALFGDMAREPGMEEQLLGEEQALEFLLHLSRQLESSDVSQAELGRRFGVQRSQIRRWISGDSALKAQTMFGLARCLGYRLEQRWVPVLEQQGGYADVSESFAVVQDTVATPRASVVVNMHESTSGYAA